MVCSSCGQERPDGDRFCGMCGTPLPHRPLSALGAEGTIRLSRGPLETSSSHERMSTAVAGLLDLLGHSGVPPASDEPRNEAPGPESAVAQIASPPPADSAEPESRSFETPEEESRFSTDSTGTESASEHPLPNFLEGVHHPLAGQPEETAATDEPPPGQPDVSKFLDALAATPDEPSKSTEAPHFPWMDDVLDQIEHEAAKTPSARDERPRFLDLLGDVSQPEAAREVPAPVRDTSPLSEASEAPLASTRSGIDMAGAKPFTRKQRLWMATAVTLVFVALAIVQWRTQIADNSKRLEQRISDKILELAAGDEADANKGQPATSADPIDLNNPPSQSRPASNSQQENAAAANAGGQAPAPKENPGPTKVTEPPSAAKPAQPPPAARNQSEASKFAGAGAHEMMRAEQAKTAAGRSEWLWKATAKGNPDAPVQLAELYVAGDGVPRSCEQAMVLLKTAALGNNARACNRLASLYTTGTCVPRSQLEAYRWLSSALAADPHNQSAQHDRAVIWQQLTPEERTLAQESR